MAGFNMADYVDVAERIREFSAKYPEGSLQSELTRQGDGWLCRAYAYRTASDERPGIGHAFEPVPGKTPYTKDSEAMNAETSAWGRAIVALGFETKKIASAQEVRARKTTAPAADAATPPAGADNSPGTAQTPAVPDDGLFPPVADLEALVVAKARTFKGEALAAKTRADIDGHRVAAGDNVDAHVKWLQRCLDALDRNLAQKADADSSDFQTPAGAKS